MTETRNKQRLRVRLVTIGIVVLVVVGGYTLWLRWLRYALFAVDPPYPVQLVVDASPESKRITVLLAGDTMLANESQNRIDRHGHRYLLSRVAELTRDANLSVVNLEAPVTRSAFTEKRKTIKYRQDPEALDALGWAGFDVLALGNNHALDCDMRGLVDTINEAAKRGLATIGAGRDESEARSGLLVRVGKVSVGLLSFYTWRLDYEWYMNYFALGRQGGVAELHASTLGSDVKRLRRAGADVVIATPHWGMNYRPISLRQRWYARVLQHAGVDAVVGHGSHDFQPIDVIETMPVVYSVGNFAFGTRGRDYFRCGLLARLEIEGNRVSALELIPIVTQNRIAKFRPRLAKGDIRDQCIGRLVKESRLDDNSLKRLVDRLRWERNE